MFVLDQAQGIENFEWKSILLGPSGLLTNIFNEFKERHKMDIGKVKPNIPQADLTPGQFYQSYNPNKNTLIL